MSKVILMDVGNTSAKIGLADEAGVIRTASVPTGATTAGGLLAAVNKLREGEAVEAVVVSSVVPLFNDVVRECAAGLSAEVFFVPSDLSVPMENRYERPREVGADRLVGAFTARQLRPDEERIVIIDFGTATTFDCVTGNAYLGGLICPGVLSSTRSLSEETAKLPKATLEIDPSGLRLGRSTLDSLNQGLVYGFAAMVEGLVERIAGVLGGKPYVMATGGFAPRIAEVCSVIQEVRKDLLMEGLRQVWFTSKGK